MDKNHDWDIMAEWKTLVVSVTCTLMHGKEHERQDSWWMFLQHVRTLLIDSMYHRTTWLSNYLIYQQMTRGPIYKISYNLSQDYLNFIVMSTYGSDLRRANISLRNIVSHLRTQSQTILRFLKWTVPKKSLTPFVRCFVDYMTVVSWS